MLVVVAIIGILVGTALPDVTGSMCDGEAAGVEMNLTTIRTAFIQCYASQLGNCDSLDKLVEADLLPDRLKEEFSDDRDNMIVGQGPDCTRGTWHKRSHYEDADGACIGLDLTENKLVRTTCPN